MITGGEKNDNNGGRSSTAARWLELRETLDFEKCFISTYKNWNNYGVCEMKISCFITITFSPAIEIRIIRKNIISRVFVKRWPLLHSR